MITSNVKLIQPRPLTLNPEQKSRLEMCISKASLDIEAWAKKAVPVDTGALKNSIQAMPTSYDMQGNIQGGVYAGMHYAGYVEFGTVHTPAQPYLIPAAERVIPSLQKALDIVTVGIFK
jgi:HK97 gp10 family phage protein